MGTLVCDGTLAFLFSLSGGGTKLPRHPYYLRKDCECACRDADHTISERSGRVIKCPLALVLQILAASASGAVSSEAPSAGNAAQCTALECPERVRRHSVLVLQILAVLSIEAVCTDAPSVENTADNTRRECPERVRKH